MDSGRGDIEYAVVFASAAPLAVSFVPKSIVWNPAEKQKWKVVAGKTGKLIYRARLLQYIHLESSINNAWLAHHNITLLRPCQGE